MESRKSEGKQEGKEKIGEGRGAAKGASMIQRKKKQKVPDGVNCVGMAEKWRVMSRWRSAREHCVSKVSQDACAWGRILFMVTLLLWEDVSCIDSGIAEGPHTLQSTCIQLTLQVHSVGILQLVTHPS